MSYGVAKCFGAGGVVVDSTGEACFAAGGAGDSKDEEGFAAGGTGRVSGLERFSSAGVKPSWTVIRSPSWTVFKAAGGKWRVSGPTSEFRVSIPLLLSKLLTVPVMVCTPCQWSVCVGGEGAAVGVPGFSSVEALLAKPEARIRVRVTGRMIDFIHSP